MAISRRDFLKGSAAGVAAGALSMVGLSAYAAGSSSSDEESTKSAAAEEEETVATEASEYTFADTIEWYAEYDVVVLGMGFAGMHAANAAAEAGASVLLAEKAPEGEAGGNSKVCGQMFAYAHEDYDAAKSYYTSLAAGRSCDEAMFEKMITSLTTTWTDIADMYFDGDDSDFHDLSGDEWGVLNYMSPEYPEYEGSDKIALCSTHTGTSDSFFYQTVKAKTEANGDKIDIWYESPGVDLIQDPDTKTIVGVKIERNNETVNVRALNGVCVCTGGFETDTDMIQQYLNVINSAPVGGLYNSGDGIKMCQRAGAQLWHMACYEGGFGLGGVSYPVEDGANCAAVNSLSTNATNSGSVILVGAGGKRFLNENEQGRHGHFKTNAISENPAYPHKIWWIFDQTQWDLLKEEETFNTSYEDAVVSASSIEELAQITEIDADGLAQTIEDFNSYAENGRDMEFGRDPEYMRAFDGDTYYAVPMKSIILNTQGGPKRNENAQVLDIDGNPIPHLYSAGEMGGFTAFMYQGGTNVAECFIMGVTAGQNAAEEKDDLEPYTAKEMVVSSPKTLGDETDLGAESTEYDTADNQYIGTGSGMGGDVTVRVTVDDGVISEVEILEEAETEGIGSNAIEQLPEQFVGLSSDEEIDALDSISGATITSDALKEAVKAALAQAQ